MASESKCIKMDFSKSGTRGQDYMSNINGKLPVIEHEGTSIWEASTITMYLGDVFGQDANLWPLQGPKRGEKMKWVAWASGCLPAAGTRVSSDLPPGAPGAIEDEALQEYVDPSERSTQRLQKAWDALTQLLKVCCNLRGHGRCHTGDAAVHSKPDQKASFVSACHAHAHYAYANCRSPTLQPHATATRVRFCRLRAMLILLYNQKPFEFLFRAVGGECI